MDNSSIDLANMTLSHSTNWFGYFSLVCSFILIAVCLIGLFGNGISILIFAQSHFRCVSINNLLLSLSISDWCFLALSMPVFASGPLIGYFGVIPNLVRVYTFCICFVYPLTSMFNCFSIWLLVAITFERWLAVCSPLKVADYCTRTRAFIVVVVVAFVSICYNCIRFWEFRIARHMYVPEMALRKDPLYILWYSTISNLVVIYVVPLVAMIYLNSRVAIQLVKSRQLPQKINATQRAERRVTQMLIFVVLNFICCYSLALLLNIIETCNPSVFASSQVGYALSYVNNVIVSLKAATSFGFYLKFSSRYRFSFLLILARIFCAQHCQQQLLDNERQNYSTWQYPSASNSNRLCTVHTKMASPESAPNTATVRNRHSDKTPQKERKHKPLANRRSTCDSSEFAAKTESLGLEGTPCDKPKPLRSVLVKHRTELSLDCDFFEQVVVHTSCHIAHV